MASLLRRRGHTEAGALEDYDTSISALCLDGFVAQQREYEREHAEASAPAVASAAGADASKVLDTAATTPPGKGMSWTVEMRNPANVRFLRPVDVNRWQLRLDDERYHADFYFLTPAFASGRAFLDAYIAHVFPL